MCSVPRINMRDRSLVYIQQKYQTEGIQVKRYSFTTFKLKRMLTVDF
jgi:hypothetical protein